MAGVKLRALEKTFENGLLAVHGINLEIKDGEFMVLVGPSGCAKSTTLRMIAGLEKSSSGDVFIGKKKVNDLPPKDREIAMVFQNYALYPHLSVFENIAYGLRIAKKPEKEVKEKVEEAARMLDITDLLNRKPKEISGGQAQRVAIGRAIVRQPEVFLFDEPLSNLDAKLRVQMRVRISKLHQELKNQGKTATMIYVTHDQVEAMTMGDRICVMNFGKIMQVDTPINIYDYPANKFAAGFIGSPSMNINKVEVAEENGKFYINLEGNKILLPKEKSKKLNSYKGKKVWFGIRPEDVVTKDLSLMQPLLQGKISLVEQMGNEVFIYFHIGEKRFTSRIPAEDAIHLKHGMDYEFSFDLKKCHIFDFFTEENISLDL